LTKLKLAIPKERIIYKLKYNQ